jgi:hypothetical protein
VAATGGLRLVRLTATAATTAEGFTAARPAIRYIASKSAARMSLAIRASITIHSSHDTGTMTSR